MIKKKRTRKKKKLNKMKRKFKNKDQMIKDEVFEYEINSSNVKKELVDVYQPEILAAHAK
jgi:hypothetical protein